MGDLQHSHSCVFALEWAGVGCGMQPEWSSPRVLVQKRTSAHLAVANENSLISCSHPQAPMALAIGDDWYPLQQTMERIT